MKTDDRSHLIHSSDNTNTYDHNVIMSSYGMEYDDTIRDGWTDGRMRMPVNRPSASPHWPYYPTCPQSVNPSRPTTARNAADDHKKNQ